MPANFSALCVFIAALSCAATLYAEPVRDLYSSEVPVADQGVEARSAGASKALTEVLVKVSGSSDLLVHPSVVNAVSRARAQVQQYAYRRDEGPENTLWARYEFAPSFVTGLVVDAGAPLWTANRPPVLVWVVVESVQGRAFVNWESMPKEAQALAKAFSRRGVPLQFPLFDLADTAALSPDAAWRLDAGVLKEASARYGLGDILGARVALLNDNRYVGDLSYFSPAGRIDRTAVSDAFGDFAATGVALVADDMAGRFAVQVADSQGIGMVVAGIHSFRDYASVVTWLEKLELVDSANVERVDGESVTLNIRARTDAQQLMALLKLNSNLQPLPGSGLGGPLQYLWQQ